MKKILIFSCLIFTFFSCEDLTELNVDPKNPLVVESGPLFANSIVELFDLMASTNVNDNNFRLWSQYWAQTTYSDESNYELNERNVSGRTWDKLYATVVKDLRDAKKFVATTTDEDVPPAEKATQTAMADILEIFTYHILVDIFGDIPYTDAIGNDITPIYDNDEDIYNTLITKLDVAINNLTGTSTWDAYDLIYGGNVDSWKKLANSLKLKLAIRIADVNDAKAKSMAEEAVAAGVFTSSTDDFVLQYKGTTPNTNPLWEDLVESNRSDFVSASTLVDAMNTLNDPRRPTYFQNPSSLTDYIGGTPGDNNSYSSTSQPGALQRMPTFPAVLIDFCEVSFLLADASSRGYNVGGTPKDHYDNGVTSSIISWGLSADSATAYLAQASVAYDTAPGTWKEKIATQKWIALYDRGFEGWTTYRLYDAPTFAIATQAGTLPPTRFTYPVTEYSLNGENVEAAGAAMGGDGLFSKVFWDVN